ncbi:hypothetical protein L1049_014140 [Liquidambar formosana]|uniref:Uncharacterized protein n=1 Tax=Liquidambar formosana TaxID=63359 RepID=A0AAP0WUP2_LIQFO
MNPSKNLMPGGACSFDDLHLLMYQATSLGPRVTEGAHKMHMSAYVVLMCIMEKKILPYYEALLDMWQERKCKGCRAKFAAKIEESFSRFKSPMVKMEGVAVALGALGFSDGREGATTMTKTKTKTKTKIGRRKMRQKR